MSTSTTDSGFYELAAELPRAGEQLRMADYKGKVVLIVNVASRVSALARRLLQRVRRCWRQADYQLSFHAARRTMAFLCAHGHQSGNR